MGLESIIGHDVSIHHYRDQNMLGSAVWREYLPMNCLVPEQVMIGSMSHGIYDQGSQSGKDIGVSKNKKLRDLN